MEWSRVPGLTVHLFGVVSVVSEELRKEHRSILVMGVGRHFEVSDNLFNARNTYEITSDIFPPG